MGSREDLRHVVELVDADELDAARAALRAALDATSDTPESVQTWVFGAALARRLAGDVENRVDLYMADYDLPQIRLFDLVARHVPLVSATERLANDFLVRALSDETQATLIDVGAGSGRQAAALVRRLSEQDGLTSLTVVLVEPARWSLDAAVRAVQQAAGSRLAVRVLPVADVVEALSDADWSRLVAGTPRPLVINAGFALHHVQPVASRDVRTDVLRRLRRLDPSVLVLAEQDMDDDTDVLAQRFDVAWRYYSAVFSILDQLGLDDRDRDALKVCYYGRIIADALARQRTERHEDGPRWRKRLQDAGFRVEAPAGDHRVHELLRVRHHDDGRVALAQGGVSLVSVFRAVPDALVDAEPAPVAEGRPLQPDPESLEVQTYLACLLALARADRVVDPTERDFVERQARLLGVEPADLWTVPPVDELLEKARELPLRTRAALLRDLVFLARVDGHYAREERREIERIATRLGVPPVQLAMLEAQAAVPAEVGAAPAWFREYWYLAQKG